MPVRVPVIAARRNRPTHGGIVAAFALGAACSPRSQSGPDRHSRSCAPKERTSAVHRAKAASRRRGWAGERRAHDPTDTGALNQSGHRPGRASGPHRQPLIRRASPIQRKGRRPFSTRPLAAKLFRAVLGKGAEKKGVSRRRFLTALGPDNQAFALARPLPAGELTQAFSLPRRLADSRW